MALNLLQMQNGAKSYGIKNLFHGASFAINEGEHVGVIGPNGAGKSTLFRILIAEETLDEGLITKSQTLRLGYLPQEDHWASGQTVEQYLEQAPQMPIWELKSLARRLGLSQEQMSKPISSLSGGYRMRVKLLYLIGHKPNLMLLDEPTNYLDLETLLVLEEFLLSYSGAFLLISHDREFLRRTTDHILEVEQGEVTKYNGNIDDYFEQKQMLREQLEARALSLSAKREAVLEFAARFGAKATKARQVQSRLKSLQKMETIEVKPLPTRAMIRLPEPQPTGKSILRMKSARLGYGEKTILHEIDFELMRGDRVGVVGLNGAGKSTLLKALAGELEPQSGERISGYQVSTAYYAQHVAERLLPDDTVLEAMERGVHKDVTRQDVLDLAGGLLFSGDDVKKKVRVLSGGEKSRVALGQILLKKAPCLLLDEPTNHLDFYTVESLTQALAGYAGTVVIVSHDRGFVSRVASKILEIDRGQAVFYPGTYDEYVWSLQKGVLAERDGLEDETKTSEIATVSTTTTNFKEKKKSLERNIRIAEKRLEALIKRMDEIRSEMESLSEQLLNVNGEKASELARALASLQAENEVSEQEWLKLADDRDRWAMEIESL